MTTIPPILAIDQGTTSSRAIVFNDKGKALHVARQEFPQQYPADGWVEHDPEEIWQSVLHVVDRALSSADLRADQVGAIGITNQRETTIIWNKKTGKPIHKAIVWQDRRTADYCETLKLKGLESLIQQKTGLLIDAYFSASKISSAGDFFLSSSKFICGIFVIEKRDINIIAFYKITSLIMV